VQDGWGYGWTGKRKDGGAKGGKPTQSEQAKARTRVEQAKKDVQAGRITFAEYKQANAAAAQDEAKALLRQGLISFGEYKLRVAAAASGMPRSAGPPKSPTGDSSKAPARVWGQAAGKNQTASKVAPLAARNPTAASGVETRVADGWGTGTARNWKERNSEQDREFIARTLWDAGIEGGGGGSSSSSSPPKAEAERATGKGGGAAARGVAHMAANDVGALVNQPKQAVSHENDGWGYGYSDKSKASPVQKPAATDGSGYGQTGGGTESQTRAGNQVAPAPARKPAPAARKPTPTSLSEYLGLGDTTDAAANPPVEKATTPTWTPPLRPMKDVAPVVLD
jgi:hypothetical protein